MFDAHPRLTLAQREAGFRKKGADQRLEGGISSIYDFARAGCTTIFPGAEHRKGSLPRISQPYVSAVLPYQRISKQASSLPFPTSITAVGGETLALLCPDSPIVSISTHAASPSTPLLHVARAGGMGRLLGPCITGNRAPTGSQLLSGALACPDAQPLSSAGRREPQSKGKAK